MILKEKIDNVFSQEFVEKDIFAKVWSSSRSKLNVMLWDFFTEKISARMKILTIQKIKSYEFKRKN